MAIIILAISLLLNVIFVVIIRDMRDGWRNDIEMAMAECHRINDIWAEKYSKLIDEYELELDTEDDLK